MRRYRGGGAGWVRGWLSALLLSLWLLSPGPAESQQAQQQAQPPAAATPPPLTVAAQTPEPGKLILERRPVITVTLEDPKGVLDPKSVIMEVDSVDVTLMIKVEAGKVTYVPPADLTHGEHTIKVTAADKSGQALPPVEWKFKIRRFAWFEEAALEGDFSGTYERAIRKPIKEPKSDSGVSKKTESPINLFSSNLRVDGLLKEGEFTAKLNSNIRYVDDFRPRPRPKDPQTKIDLANYLINLNRKPVTFDAGDIVINQGFFAAPSLSRRGMQLQIDGMERVGLQFSIFGTRYETMQGHDPFFGVERDNESILWGQGLAWSPFADRELLKLYGVHVQGHRIVLNAGVNVGTIASGEEGDLWSFGTTSSLFGGKAKILTEVAFAEFDTDTTDEFHEQADKAYRGRIEGMRDVAVFLDSPVMVKAGAEYSYVGFSFRSPANPGLQPDREGWNISADTLWKIVTLTVGFSTFSDNTDRLETLPTVRVHAWNTALTLAPPELPSVTLNYNRADQRSFREPDSFGPFKAIDNIQSTYGLTLAYSQQAWSANVGGTYTFFDDKRFVTETTAETDKNTWTTQASLTLNLIRDLSISPSFNYTLVDDRKRQVTQADGTTVQRPVRNETLTGTFTLGYEFIPKILKLDLQASGASAQSSDDTVDNQTYSGVTRLTWELGKLFWDYGRQAVSLRLNFNRVLDHVARSDRNEIGIFFILDLLAPYKL